jgi:hypothetical protein
MNFILSMLAYIVMAIVLGLGILLAVKGTFWLLIVSLLAYIFLVVKFGCATH